MDNLDNVMRNNSDLELYRILFQKRSGYTPEAVRAAEEEYRLRAFSDEQMAAFRKHIEEEEEERLARKNRKDQLGEKLGKALSIAIPTRKETPVKSITSLCIFLGLVYFYFLISAILDQIWIYLEYDLLGIYPIMPYLLYPIGIYGLWKLKSYGWHILVVLLTHYAVLFLYQVYWEFRYIGFGMTETDGFLGAIDSFIPRTPLGIIVLNAVFFSGMLLYLNRKEVLELTSVSRASGRINMVVTLLLSLLFVIWVMP